MAKVLESNWACGGRWGASVRQAKHSKYVPLSRGCQGGVGRTHTRNLRRSAQLQALRNRRVTCSFQGGCKGEARVGAFQTGENSRPSRERNQNNRANSRACRVMISFCSRFRILSRSRSAAASRSHSAASRSRCKLPHNARHRIVCCLPFSYIAITT